MMQKYRMEQYNRWNRDRVGGHDTSEILEQNNSWPEFFGPNGRKFSKRRVNKQRRREHHKITHEALYYYQLDAYEDHLDRVRECYEDFYEDDYEDYSFDHQEEEYEDWEWEKDYDPYYDSYYELDY